MPLIGYDHSGTAQVGLLHDDGTVSPLGETGRFWADPAAHLAAGSDGPRLEAADLHCCPPLPPAARVVCVGLNYRDHAQEGPFGVPDHPEYFGRWTPAVGVSGRTVRTPRGEPGLDWEAELAVVIGRRLCDVDETEAMAGVLGYAAFNDITARRAQHRGRQWTLGKNVDDSGVLGPIALAHDVGDPRDGWDISAHVNGERVQHSSTDRLIFGVDTLIADLASVMTLHPGDVIATGTPEGVGHRQDPPRFLGDGDVVTVTIQGLAPITTTIQHHGVEA